MSLIINGIDFDKRIRLAKARIHILIDRHYERIKDDPMTARRRAGFFMKHGILFHTSPQFVQPSYPQA